MSNRIYPSWEQIKQLKNPFTEGEMYLLKFLDSNLPTDPNWTDQQKLSEYQGWLIFAQPFLNGSRPDVIIFNPYVGIVIYEVKDWKIEHYKWKKVDNYNRLFVSDSKGSYRIKNPINQVNHYKEKIIGQLVPNIGEVIDKNKKNYGLIKTAIYFHKINTSTAQDFFGAKIPDFKYFPVFGKDLLTNGNLNQIVPDVQYSKSRYWDRKWNKELMFWFYPPFHSIEQGIPLTLKGNQNKVAEPATGHHRVRGVAGSGKTQALAYRAGRLASMNMNVLVISFNITLWHYVRDMISRSPFGFKWDRFTFTHFHGFCKDKLNEFGKDWPKSPELKDYDGNKEEYEKALDYFFKVKIAEAVKDAVLDKQFLKYDAILIDEGQDYHFEWYKLLNDLFLNERDELLVVSDKKQNIYERQLDWVDKRVTRDGLDKFNNPYIDLTSSYRMPAKVAEMSNEFSDLFELNQDLRIRKIEDTPVLFHSQHIVWLNILDDLWLDFVYHSFLRLKKEEYTPSDMVILLPSHSYGIEAVKFFKEKNIETNHVFEDDTEAKYHPHKKAFWMGDSRLKISTIHSFKGWELLNIILFIPKKAPESNKKLDAIIYTAITRTRENLIVLNANKRYSEFGEKFPKKWKEQ